jgi:hypothetical protein
MERAAKDRRPAISNSAGVKNSSVPELFLPIRLLADSDACIHRLGCCSGKMMCLPAWKLGRLNAGAANLFGRFSDVLACWLLG